jgi:hypothetical protein
MFLVRITLHCKSHKKSTAPSASTEHNIYAKFILTFVLSALHRQPTMFVNLHNFYATRNNTSLPAQTIKTKKLEDSKSTDNRFVGAGGSAAQHRLYSTACGVKGDCHGLSNSNFKTKYCTAI